MAKRFDGLRDSEQEDQKAQLVKTIQAWTIIRLAKELKLKPADIDIREPVSSYGLDSIGAFTLTGELAEWLGYDLPSTLFWDYPTLEALALYLAERVGYEEIEL